MLPGLTSAGAFGASPWAPTNSARQSNRHTVRIGKASVAHNMPNRDQGANVRELPRRPNPNQSSSGLADTFSPSKITKQTLPTAGTWAGGPSREYKKVTAQRVSRTDLVIRSI